MRRRRMGRVQARLVPLRAIDGSVLSLDDPHVPGHRSYRSLLEVSGVPFALLAPEERLRVFTSYQAFCRALPFPTQLCLRIRPAQLDLRSLLDPLIEHPLWGPLSRASVDLLAQQASGEGLVERSVFLALPADPGLGHAQAAAQLRERVALVRRFLEPVGVRLHLLEGLALARRYDESFGLHRATLTQTMIEHPTPPLHLKDVLAPAAIRVEADCLVIEEQEYVTSLSLGGVPRTVVPGWLHPVLVCTETLDLILQQAPWRQEVAVQTLRRKAAQFQSAVLYATRRGRPLHPLTALAARDLGPTLDAVASGEEALHHCGVLVLVRADSKEALEQRVRRVNALLSSSSQHRGRRRLFEQEQGFREALLGTLVPSHPLTLSSTGLATLFPLVNGVLTRPGPTAILEGITHEREAVRFDPWRDLPNANRLIVAPSGQGKSYKTKVDLLRRWMQYQAQAMRQGTTAPATQFLVLDPEQEWVSLAHTLGGSVVQFAPGSPYRLNLFDLPMQGRDRGETPDQRLALHIQQLHLLLDRMLAPSTPEHPTTLSGEEKALLDQALLEVYRPQGMSARLQRPQPWNAMPVLGDLYTILEQGVCGPDPTRLAQRLYRYAFGSLRGLFGGHTTVTLDAPLIVFDVKALDEEIQPLVLLVVLQVILTRSFGSTIPRWLVIDELATLSQTPMGARFCEQVFQRARKQFLSVTGITQHPETLRESAIPRNCAVQIFLGQNRSLGQQMQAHFQLSPQEVHLLDTLPPGEGLMRVNGTRMQVHFVASPLEHTLATSHPVERAQRMQDEGPPSWVEVEVDGTPSADTGETTPSLSREQVVDHPTAPQVALTDVADTPTQVGLPRVVSRPVAAEASPAQQEIPS